jgi:hypothetical protein
MKRVVTSFLALIAGATVLAAPDSDGRRWWSFVSALASDEMQGRETGSPGHRKAANYVASQFQRAGLKPAGVGGFLQPVKFQALKIVESNSRLELVRNGKPETLRLGEDAVFSLRTDPADMIEAPLVFVGYGLTVPELKFDDLAGLDLKGKIVVTIDGGPSNIPGNLLAHYGYRDERRRFLQEAGVVGMVTIVNPHHMDIPWERYALLRFDEAMALADPELENNYGIKMLVNVNSAHADKWLDGSGHTIAELMTLADAGKPLPHFPLVPSLVAKMAVERRPLESQNVAAVRPGSDPELKDEYLVLSAHLDHLGIGQPIRGDKIYNGAMDDATGVATLLEIAERLHETNATTKRSLLFLAVTGEEKGLLGSNYFAAHPTVPIERIVADLNTDMFLPLYPLRLLTVFGVGESDLGDDVRKVAESMHLGVQDDPKPLRNIFVRSDQYNFVRRGVPAIMPMVGNRPGSAEEKIEQAWLTNRYHAPSDDLQQPIDLQAAADFNRFMEALVEMVANQPARPQWKQDSFFRRFSRVHAQ